jgi:hypothetical protein
LDVSIHHKPKFRASHEPFVDVLDF